MSVREEDKEKKSGSSRGLGLGLAATAAMGVGVGAALYCFINKRTETPTAEGSTTRGWNCASADTLIKPEDSLCNSDDSYTTVSEHSTTDTSMFEDSLSCKCDENDTYSDTSEEDGEETDSTHSDTEGSTSTDVTDSESDDSDVSMFSLSSDSQSSDSDWDLSASLHSPSYSFPTTRDYLENYARSLFKSRRKDERNDTNSRAEAFRERSASLEECSICFEVILCDQEIMSLPCTHNFHTKCILPWLQERQTCPNCRKSID